MSHDYNIWSINKELRILTVVRMETKGDGCPKDLLNITLDNTSLWLCSYECKPNFCIQFPPEKQNQIPIASKCPVKATTAGGFYVDERKLIGKNMKQNFTFYFVALRNVTPVKQEWREVSNWTAKLIGEFACYAPQQ